MADKPTLSRNSDDLELRGPIAKALMQALDALAQLDGDKPRMVYVVEVLQLHVQKEVHRASVLTRMLRGNPLLAESVGPLPERLPDERS